MRVLLTGSTGWLGRHLAPRLAALGHEVTGLDVAPGPHTQVIGSVASRTTVDRVFADHSIEIRHPCGRPAQAGHFPLPRAGLHRHQCHRHAEPARSRRRGGA